MRLTPWIERLHPLVPTTVERVGGAADYTQAAQDTQNHSTGLWVIPLAEQAEPNALVTGVRQRITGTVGVIIAVRQLRDATGRAALDALDPVRDAVRTRLVGWVPVAGHDPVIRGHGALLDFTHRVLWWRDEYTSAWHEGHH